MKKFNLHKDMKKSPITGSARLLFEFILLFPFSFVIRYLCLFMEYLVEKISNTDVLSFGNIKYWKKIYKNAYFYEDKSIAQEIRFDMED